MRRAPAFRHLFPRRLSHRLSHRSGWLAAAVVAALVAIGYFAAAYSVVFTTTIGDIAFTVDAQRGWGVHTGDALAVPLVVLGLLSLAASVVCAERSRPRPVAVVVPRRSR